MSLVTGPETDFHAGAAERLTRFMIGIGFMGAALARLEFGRAAALGFVAGSVISFLNFRWLKSGVAGLADRVTNSGQPRSGKGLVARFLLRYILMGAAAYGILTSFPASLRGLFAGFFLPVGAIACEAAYETYMAITGKN